MCYENYVAYFNCVGSARHARRAALYAAARVFYECCHAENACPLGMMP